MSRCSFSAGVWACLVGSIAAVGVMAGGPARAQDLVPQPPIFQAVDANGVDVLSRKAVLYEDALSVGPSGQGLRAKTVWDSKAIYPYDINSGRIHFDPEQMSMTLSYEGQSKRFEAFSGGFYSPVPDDGGTLTRDSTQWTYTAHDGTVVHYAGFNPFTPDWPTRGIRDSALTQIVRPDGEVVNFTGGGSFQAMESSLGYQVSPNLSSGTGTNLACSGTCDGATVQSAQTLGRAHVYDMPGSSTSSTTLVVHNPAGRALRSYVLTGGSGIRGAREVSSVTDGAGTWTYSVNDVCSPSGCDIGGTRTLTVTDPLGHTRVVTSTFDGPVLSDQDGEGHVTTYAYDNQQRLVRVTHPEGSVEVVVYDDHSNVTALWRLPKGASAGAAPESVSGATVVRAGYPTTCDASNYKICNKPLWVQDARGAQTDYTYSADHGGVLTVTGPAPSSGAVRPQTRYTYGQFTARYVRGGVMQPAATSVWRVTQTSTCQTLGPAVGTAPAPCAGTADEVVTSYAYEPSNVANNVRLLSTTTRSGDGVLAATTNQTYDLAGNVIAVDGPLSGTADTTKTYYDASRWPVGIIGPDPDGGGGLLYRASRTTYAADGLVTSVETGTAANQSDSGMSTFAALQTSATAYDNAGRKISDSLVASGATQTLTQYAYDAANRLTCSAVRMAPTASQPASACTPTLGGADGDDRVTYTAYDNADRVIQVTSGYGTTSAGGAPRIEKTVTYTANGQEQTVADGKGNLTTYEYDGFDRLVKVRYPNTSGTGSSTTDYEEYGYDPAGNRTSWRRRDGATAAFTYDALNRAQNGLRGEAYAYDNLGRRTSATYAGQTALAAFDALGRMTSETTNGLAMSYQYDLAGHRTRITWPDNFYITYDYDAAGQMKGLGENGGGYAIVFVYDDLGRMKTVSRGAPATTYYDYDAASRLSYLSHDLSGTAQDQSWTFAYNAAGQVKTRTASNSLYEWSQTQVAKSYTVNGLNQYATVAGAALQYDLRGNLQTNAGTTYGYDLLNNLTSTSAGAALTYEPTGRLWQVSAGGTTTNFLYSGPDLVAEYNGATLLRRYVPGAGTDAAAVRYEGASTADRRYLLADAQGSIVAAVNDSGAAIATNTYDEYGVPTGDVGRFQYTGQIWLPEVGLYHYKARAYSPTLGRFLQTDPIGYDDGLNWYAYVGNDPINRTDPTGMLQYWTDGGFCESGCDGSISGSGFSAAQPSAVAKGTAIGAVAGAGVGVAVAAACDAATVGVCALGNPAIVTGGAALGGITGAAVANAGPALQQAGEAAGNVVEEVVVQAKAHANSYRSQRPTWLYQLQNRRSGEILKYGITSAPVPADRYPAWLYGVGQFDLVPLDRYPNRASARAAEVAACTGYMISHGGARPPLSVVC